MIPRNLDPAKLLQMRREPLRIEQHKLSCAQMLDQPDERNLRGIGHPMKHRFTKKRPPDGDTVKSAGQLALTPGFDRMRVTKLVQPRVTLDNFPIDPGVFAFGAGVDDFRKAIVDLDLKSSFPQDPAQRVRQVKFFQWQNRAWVGREPFDCVFLHRHRENTEPIALQQKFRVNHREKLALSWAIVILAMGTLLFNISG
jgi:hypothetical protein